MPKQLLNTPETQNRLDMVIETLPVPCLCTVGFSDSRKNRCVSCVGNSIEDRTDCVLAP